MIEDSPYSKLYFDKELPSISLLVPKQSFHLGSFSKTLAPAFHIRWIRADKKLLQLSSPIKKRWIYIQMAWYNIS